MDPELPERLYEEGTEPQVDKINNCCRMSILELLVEKMPHEYNEVKKDPVFGPILAIHDNSLAFSAILVHSLMCRQLLTAKKHELWFLFARRPLRFSLQEYHAVTGLKCEDDGNYDLKRWVNDDGFWSRVLMRGNKICIQSIRNQHIPNSHRWTRKDRLRLVYLSVIAGLLMVKDEKVAIPHDYIKLVMDISKLRAYPWGLHSFDHLVEGIEKARTLLSNPKSYVLQGFVYAFQIWIMEAIHDLGVMFGNKLNEVDIVFPRCTNWSGHGQVHYGDIIDLENKFGSEGVLYSYISETGNMDVLESSNFVFDDEMRDERVDHMNALIRSNNDWSQHIWKFEERVAQNPPPPAPNAEVVEDGSADDAENFRTPCADATTTSASGKGKRKVIDKGAEARKRQILSQREAASKRGDADQGMKTFLRGMIQESEAKILTENYEKYGKLESEFMELKGELSQIKDLLRQALRQGNPGEPSTSSQSASAQQSQREVKGTKNVSDKLHDVDLTQSLEDNMDEILQASLLSKIDDLSQDTYVPGFNPSQQAENEDPLEFKTPMTSLHPVTISLAEKLYTPSLKDFTSRQSDHDHADNQLVSVSDESWEQLRQWFAMPESLPIGPTEFTPELARRVVGPAIWLMNQQLDAVMYVFREKTSLRRWKPDRVGFMSHSFTIQIKNAHKQWKANKRKFVFDEPLIAFGKGESPSHGRTNKVWDVDVDCIYVPLSVSGCHWIAMCISFVERTIQVFDCNGLKRYKEVEAFAVMIPRLVKEVQTTASKRNYNVSPYTVVYAPMEKNLNNTQSDCGVYALKFIECHVLGLGLNLVNDGNIKEARQKIAADLFEAAKDPVLIQMMAHYIPPKFAPGPTVEIS